MCSDEAQPPTMVDMVNSDEIVPEFENDVDIPEHESIVDEVPNDFTDIVKNIRHPVKDVPVCAVEVPDLITEQEVPKFQTPPRGHQNRLAKSCQRRVFDINSMLEVVEEKEREKILSRTMGNHQEAFTKEAIHYFSKLIKDVRRSFCSKVEVAQLLLKIFGAKLDETDFQIWLAEVLRLKDQDELLTFMEYSEEDKTTFTPRGQKFFSIRERQPTLFFKLDSVTNHLICSFFLL